MQPSISVSIKVVDEEEAKEVAHVTIIPHDGSYKYMVQEPGGGIVEGEVSGFHRDRGVLTLLGLVLSDAGHLGKLVQVPQRAIAEMLGHEKMEEIRKDLDEQGD